MVWVVEGISCVSSITYAGIRRKVLIMSHLARRSGDPDYRTTHDGTTEDREQKIEVGGQ